MSSCLEKYWPSLFVILAASCDIRSELSHKEKGVIMFASTS